MAEEQMIIVHRADFENVARQLTEWVATLTPAEQGVIYWLMQRAAGKPWRQYRPRGAKHLVFGGADGLTVLFGRSGFVVTPPEGPLPVDLSRYFNAATMPRGEFGLTD